MGGDPFVTKKEVLFILKKRSEKSISFREPDDYEFLDEKRFDYLFKHINKHVWRDRDPPYFEVFVWVTLS